MNALRDARAFPDREAALPSRCAGCRKVRRGDESRARGDDGPPSPASGRRRPHGQGRTARRHRERSSARARDRRRRRGRLAPPARAQRAAKRPRRPARSEPRVRLTREVPSDIVDKSKKVEISRGFPVFYRSQDHASWRAARARSGRPLGSLRRRSPRRGTASPDSRARERGAARWRRREGARSHREPTATTGDVRGMRLAAIYPGEEPSRRGRGRPSRERCAMSEFDAGSGRRGFVRDVMRRISVVWAVRTRRERIAERERNMTRSLQEEIEDLREAMRFFGGRLRRVPSPPRPRARRVRGAAPALSADARPAHRRGAPEREARPHAPGGEAADRAPEGGGRQALRAAEHLRRLHAREQGRHRGDQRRRQGDARERAPEPRPLPARGRPALRAERGLQRGRAGGLHEPRRDRARSSRCSATTAPSCSATRTTSAS